MTRILSALHLRAWLAAALFIGSAPAICAAPAGQTVSSPAGQGQVVGGHGSAHARANAVRSAQPNWASNLPREAAIWEATASDVSKMLKSLAKALDETPTANRNAVSTARAAAAAMDVLTNLEKDLEAARVNGSPSVVLSSNTLEGFGKLGLDLIEWVSHDGGMSAPSLKSDIARLGSYGALVAGAARAVGKGELDAGVINRLTQGALGLARRELIETFERNESRRLGIGALEKAVLQNTQSLARVKALHSMSAATANRAALETQIVHLTRQINAQRGVLGLQQAKLAETVAARKSALMYLDAAPALATAIAMQRKAGHLTREAIDAYSDFFIIAASSFLVDVLPGPRGWKPFVRDAMVAGARYIRNDIGSRIDEHYRARFELVERYARYQLAQTAKHSASRPIDEVFTREQLRRAGISDRQLREMNAQTVALNAHLKPLAQVRVPDPTPAPAPISKPDLKGVTVNPDPIFEPTRSVGPEAGARPGANLARMPM